MADKEFEGMYRVWYQRHQHGYTERNLTFLEAEQLIRDMFETGEVQQAHITLQLGPDD